MADENKVPGQPEFPEHKPASNLNQQPVKPNYTQQPVQQPQVQTNYYTPQAPSGYGNIPSWLQGLVVKNGGQVPHDGTGFSWAAFLFSWIYFFVRGQWKVALAILGVSILLFILNLFIPLVGFLGIVVNILSGLYGKSLAFLGAEPGKFPTTEALNKADKPWIIVGVILIVLSILFSIIGFIVLGSLIFAVMSDPTAFEALN